MGPHQTAAEHIYQISNSLSSGVTGSYQSNPLVSTTFQSGMLSPVSPKWAAYLIGAHPKEVVLFAIIDSITITSVKTKRVAKFVNDPDQDYDSKDSDITPEMCRLKYNPVSRYIDPSSVHSSPTLFPGTTCSYSKFANILKTLVSYGFTFEPIIQKAQTPTNTNNSNSNSMTQPDTSVLDGRICLDPSVNSHSLTGWPLCNTQKGTGATPSSKTITYSTKLTFDHLEATMGSSQPIPADSKAQSDVIFRTQSDGNVSLTVQLRSPQQVFNYMGSWLRNSRSVVFGDYIARKSNNILTDNELYVDVVADNALDCYVSVSYGGHQYCVPQNSRHTALLMDILENLRNLSISPSDLNSAFTVRLTNGP